ncbi:MAG: NAD(P)-dependent oxidoreductase [Bifidobacteriaceae bacterium]|jgi:2-hydroxy-3-oxopropionate reductase|nr:NAD(P)-dependent oxidoreductase [Bifidobacteriaceae bacterium]
MSARTGFIGLGKMGEPMARNLLKAGIPVAAWDIIPAKVEALRAAGGERVESASDVAREVVITMTVDLPEVVTLLEGPEGLLAGWAKRGITDPILVVMSTVSPTAIRQFGLDVRASHQVHVVDAPVSGGDIGAQRGTLSIMIGGAEADVAPLEGHFAALGTVARHLGPLGSGQIAKSCNQIIVAATVISLAEAMVYARRSGLDLAALVELLQGGLADCELLRQKGWRLLQHDYAGGGALANQVKDLRFALEQARMIGVPLPGAAASAEFFSGLMAMGFADEDHTAAQRIFETLAGEQGALDEQ